MGFPECVARVPVSLWGSGGWGCSLDDAQPFPTVHKCPCEGRMAVPMASSAKVVTFGGFQRRVASFRMAGVALRDIQFTLPTLHFTLYTCHSTLHTLHFTLLAPHFTLHTPHFTLHTLHFTLYTLYSTLYTLHFTLYTLHFPTPHSTLHTLRSTLYTLHSTLCTPSSSAFHSLQCTGTVTGGKCTRLFK